MQIAEAHPALIYHQHPHSQSLLFGDDAIVLAFAVGLGFIVSRWRRTLAERRRAPEQAKSL